MMRVLFSIYPGAELEAFLKDKEPFDRIFYVGDGSNDYCPIIRLREYVLLNNTNL